MRTVYGGLLRPAFMDSADMVEGLAQRVGDGSGERRVIG
jgi:hypothetical protein